MEASTGIPLLCLMAVTVICSMTVYPRPYYALAQRCGRLPQWLVPVCDDDGSPADEARRVLSLYLLASALGLAVLLYAPVDAGAWRQGVFLLYAGLTPAYFLHRCFCLHKLDAATSYTTAFRTTRLTAYRRWTAVAIWLCVAAMPVLAVTGTCTVAVCNVLPLLLSVAAVVFLLSEMSWLYRQFREERDEYRASFMDYAPHGYYLLLALAGIALAQTALWTGNPRWLTLWMAILAAFTVIDYRLRYCADNGLAESRRLPRVIRNREARRMYRKGLEALGRKGIRCWLTITRYAHEPQGYRVELVADMAMKCREINIEGGILLYVRRCRDTRMAVYDCHHAECEDAAQELVGTFNPEGRNLALLPVEEIMKTKSDE